VRVSADRNRIIPNWAPGPIDRHQKPKPPARTPNTNSRIVIVKYTTDVDGRPRALKIGGRGTWRVGRDVLEAYIERAYV